MRDIANKRQAIHVGHVSSHPLSNDYEYIGRKGEAEFALRSGLQFDATARPSGDKGTDFTLTILMASDIKTARKPYPLNVERGKVAADIYVVAGCEDESPVTFYGRAWRPEVQTAPVKDFGHGILNHDNHPRRLHSPASRDARLGR